MSDSESKERETIRDMCVSSIPEPKRKVKRLKKPVADVDPSAGRQSALIRTLFSNAKVNITQQQEYVSNRQRRNEDQA
jgi:hypothetical protein